MVMGKALEYPVVFKVLLDGGLIYRRRPVCKKEEYELYLHGMPVGHITRRQFEQLVHQGIIERSEGFGVDKHGTVTSYFYLRQEKGGDLE